MVPIKRSRLLHNVVTVPPPVQNKIIQDTNFVESKTETEIDYKEEKSWLKSQKIHIFSQLFLN